MANKIVLKKTSTAAKVPLSTDLEVGEIAVNLADQKLYSKNAAGTVILVGQGVGGSGSVTSVATGTGLTGGPITTSGTISLANTAVTAGSYTNASITVDAQGRITSASSGSGGGVTSITGTANQITASASTGAITLSLPSTINVNTSGTAAGLSGTPNISAGTLTASAITSTVSSGVNLTLTKASGAYLQFTDGSVLRGGINGFNGADGLEFTYGASSTQAMRINSSGLTATTFNGAGTGLTGTAASLSIGGNAATATNASQLNGLTKSQMWNNSGQNHIAYQSFSAIPDFGVWFMQNASAADVPQAYQFYTNSVGLGNEYAYSSYAMQTAIARNVVNPYQFIRYKEGGSWGSWTKTAAGYADTAGSATSATTATTATTLTSTQSNWGSTGVISNVVGMLGWKNYSNSHVIFDASNSTTPSGTACNNANAQVAWTGTYPTLMGWNGGNTFGVRVDSARIADSVSSITSAAMPAGSILQVLQAVNNTTYTVGSGTTALTGMSITITPRNANSRFRLSFGGAIGKSGGAAYVIKFYRNGSDLTTVGSGTYRGFNGGVLDAACTPSGNTSIVDSPATASAITYTVYISNDGTAAIGRRAGDTFIGTSQTFQVWEIAG